MRRLLECPACGKLGAYERAGRPIEIESESDLLVGPVTGFRGETPDVTYERLKHHISPISGIVSHVEMGMFHGYGPIRTYVAGHHFALKSNDLWFLKDGLRTHSSGKGWTGEQARTSALCEAIERHSGVFRGSELVIATSLSELGEEAIDPRQVMLYSERQYAEREEWPARRSRFQFVPHRFCPDETMDWTPAWSLTRRRVRYLPTSLIYYNYPTGPNLAAGRIPMVPPQGPLSTTLSRKGYSN